MGTKFTGLTGLGAAPADDDIIAIADDPGGSPSSKSVTISNLRAATSGKAYGGIYGVDSASSLTLTTQNTWYQILNFTADMPSNGVTPAHGSDDITIITAGDYKADFRISFSGTGNQDYEAEIKKNNGVTSFPSTKMKRKLGAGGDVGSASGAAYITLANADTVELWIRCTTSSGASITATNVQLMVELKR